MDIAIKSGATQFNLMNVQQSIEFMAGIGGRILAVLPDVNLKLLTGNLKDAEEYLALFERKVTSVSTIAQKFLNSAGSFAQQAVTTAGINVGNIYQPAGHVLQATAPYVGTFVEYVTPGLAITAPILIPLGKRMVNTAARDRHIEHLKDQCLDVLSSTAQGNQSDGSLDQELLGAKHRYTQLRDRKISSLGSAKILLTAALPLIAIPYIGSLAAGASIAGLITGYIVDRKEAAANQAMVTEIEKLESHLQRAVNGTQQNPVLLATTTPATPPAIVPPPPAIVPPPPAIVPPPPAIVPPPPAIVPPPPAIAPPPPRMATPFRTQGTGALNSGLKATPQPEKSKPADEQDDIAFGMADILAQTKGNPQTLLKSAKDRKLPKRNEPPPPPQDLQGLLFAAFAKRKEQLHSDTDSDSDSDSDSVSWSDSSTSVQAKINALTLPALSGEGS